METEEVVTRISQVIMALNNVFVSGKDNLGNLAGSIAVLEEIVTALQKSEK